MHKSKKTTATFDAISSLTPEEAGALLSSDDSLLNKTISSGDPVTFGGGGSTSPYGPMIINPTIGGGISRGTITSISISVSDIVDRIEKLEKLVALLQVELVEAKKRGGFWRRPNI